MSQFVLVVDNNCHAHQAIFVAGHFVLAVDNAVHKHKVSFMVIFHRLKQVIMALLVQICTSLSIRVRVRGPPMR